MNVFIDADACPVKQETYRVAERYGLPITLVANCNRRIPLEKTERSRFSRNLDKLIQRIRRAHA